MGKGVTEMNMRANSKIFLCILIAQLQLFTYCQWHEARQNVEIHSLTMFEETEPIGTNSAEFNTVRSDDNDDILPELNRFRTPEDYAALKWQININVSCLALGDVDQDGINDIVIGNYDRQDLVSYIYVCNGVNGSMKWNYTSPFNWRCYGILIEDINNNGTPDIIIYGGEFRGWIRGFEYNGTGYTEKWMIDSNNVDEFLYPVFDIAVGDVDNDRTKELIVATGGGDYSDYEGYIYIFDASNHVLEWESPCFGVGNFGTDPRFGAMVTNIEIADVDNDGVCEIIVGTSGDVGLFVFDGMTHEPEWIYELYTAGDFYGDRCTGLTTCVLHEKDTTGILISAEDDFPYQGNSPHQQGYIYLFNGSTYDLEWRSDNLYYTGNLAVDDLDNDTKNEIIVGTVGNITNGSGNEKIYVFDATNFEILWEYDLDLYYDEYPYFTPVVASGDVDNDPQKEVIIGGKEHLCVFDVRARKPDLTPDRISLSSLNITENEIVYVNTTVWNLGRMNATDIPVEFAVDNVTINSTTLNSLPVYSSQPLSFQWVAVAGDHRLKIMVDRDHIINESDEDNNIIGLNISINAIPTPLFMVYPQIVHTLEEVNFDASNSTDMDPIQYYFDFGDGNTTDWINYSIVNHSYSDDGIFEARLKVRDVFTESDWTIQEITVLNRLPIASPTANKTIVYTYVPIEFKANANDFDGTMTYNWDFGDENISTSPDPIHTYSNNGIYTVNLTIEDDDGAKIYSKMLITVLNRPPIVNATANKLVVCANETIQFSSNSYDLDGEVINYTWDFGDDSFSYTINPMHAYPNGGVYYVNLSIMDDDNSTNYTIIAIIVNSDLDDDGIPDYLDRDIDGDGWNNTTEIKIGTDPYDNTSFPPDMDGDGIADSLDLDRDGDGIANVDDAYPDDGDKWDSEGDDDEKNSHVYLWVGIIILVFIIAVSGAIIIFIKKRKEKEVEQSLKDDLGRVEKDEIE